mmetsp:Transcript_475/g.1112  ORF Transcript_475/g.1112 Transcript_475/m.1112 type:complete len:683 (+) Transcript_475:174-2222(+)
MVGGPALLVLFIVFILGLSDLALSQDTSCTCTTTLASTTTKATRSGSTTTLDAALSGCPVQQDLVILVASPSSTSPSRDLKLLGSFFADLLAELPLPTLRAGVLLTGGSTTTLVSDVTDDLDILTAGLSAMTPLDGEVFLGPALSSAALSLTQAGQEAAKSLVLVMDTLPADVTEFSARAAELQAADVEIILLWIAAPSGGSSAPSSLRSIASTPLATHILELASASALSASAAISEQVQSVVRASCPCVAGTLASVISPETGEVVQVELADSLDSGESATQDCATDFPKYAGDMSLSCIDGVLWAAESCTRACLAGSKAIASVGDMQGEVTVPSKVVSGGTWVVNCSDVIDGTSGTMTATCREGALAVQHDCSAVCLASASGGTSSVVAWSGSDLALPIPTEGLESGHQRTSKCSRFSSSSSSAKEGQLSYLCLGGTLKVFGECFTAADCSIPEDLANAAEAVAYIVFGMGMTALFSGIALLLWRCSKAGKEVMTIRKFVTLGVQAQAGPPPPETRAEQVQTEGPVIWVDSSQLSEAEVADLMMGLRGDATSRQLPALEMQLQAARERAEGLFQELEACRSAEQEAVQEAEDREQHAMRRCEDVEAEKEARQRDLEGRLSEARRQAQESRGRLMIAEEQCRIAQQKKSSAEADFQAPPTRRHSRASSRGSQALGASSGAIG